jgi:hypothetical protein
MSADKQALEACIDDLWRVTTVLRRDLEGPEPVGDIHLFDDAVQALIGLVAARRRRMKLRSRITGKRPARTPHIAAWIDQGRDHDGCRPADQPYSTDPVDWARAFLKSGDWGDEMLTYRWFCNAMRAANPDAVTPEDPFWDDVPMHPHGRAIRPTRTE